ncbi:MAG: hypothetical protein Q7R87_03600 [Nanoarchaeota archaeon]|nr:hypothetical protein [Nanoarchaeota archaeon]
MESQYVKELMARSRDCECPGLEALFARKAIAVEREMLCSYLDSQVELEHPVEADREFLIHLKQEKRDFQASVHRYQRAIRDLSTQGRITFFVHDESKGPVREVNYSDAYTLSQEQGLPVTANCSRCDTQFDVL